MTADPFAQRRAVVLDGLDIAGRGVEFGPLDNPIARKPEFDVVYVDHADTDTIRAKYEGHEAVGAIVDVDIAWTGRLASLVPTDVPIRWAIASHVIEHVPDLIVWLDEISEVVTVGGTLSLVVPDHRYCFDANRRPSRPSEVLGAALERRTRPSVEQLVDYLSLVTAVDTAAIWQGASTHAAQEPRWRSGHDQVSAILQSTDYVDCHCWTFTPTTFLDVLEASFAAGLLAEWTILRIDDTPPGFLEFYVKLERVESGTVDEAATQRSVDHARASLRPRSPSTSSANAHEVLLSPLEAQIIGLKRRLTGVARRAPGVSWVMRRREHSCRPHDRTSGRT